MEILNTIFTVCIIVGFAIPILNIFFGFFDSLDFEIGGDCAAGVGVGFHFTSGMLGIAIFGILGKFTLGRMFTVLVVMLAVAGGMISYFLVFKLVYKPLKKNRDKILVPDMDDLIGHEAEIILRISADSKGTIKTTDATGASITYPAVSIEEDLKKYDGFLPQGMKVAVVDVDKETKTCIVKVIDF